MRSSNLSPAIFWAASILFPLTLAGCGNSNQPAPTTSPKNAEPVKSTAAKIGQKPTEQECRDWAARFERAAIEGDQDAFNATIDFGAMLESATGGIHDVADLRKKFIKECKVFEENRGSLAAAIFRPVSAGGSYDFLRAVDVDNQMRVRFRLLGNDSGLNYHEWIVVRGPKAEVKAVDVYIYLSSELMSKTLRREYLSLVANESRSVLAKLTNRENEYVKNSPKMESMLAAILSGNHSQVPSIYDSLPPSMKKDKFFLLLNLQAAAASGDDLRHLAAIDEFRKFHPNDSCLTLMSLDYHLLNKDYGKTIDCCQQMEKAIGGDPYLRCLQGRIHNIKGDPQTARRLMSEAIQAEPTLIGPYWGLVEVSLAEKNFDETNRLLDQLEQQFQIEFEDLTQIPEYAEYVKSPQYQQWLKKLNTNRH